MMNNKSLSRSLDDACHRLTNEVRKHPLLTISAAVGVGALLGAIARQATGTPGSRKNWLTDVASDLSGHAHEATNCARRAKRQANKELHAAVNRAASAVPEVDIDRLVRRGRHWLRAQLS